MSEETDYELDDEALLELSDEDLLNLASPPVASTATEEEDTYEEDSYEEDDDSEEDYYTDDTSDDSDPYGGDSSDDSNFDNENEYTDNDDYEDEVEEKPSKKGESSQATNIDYKAVYEQIFAPFKANGKEIQVRSADEVIQLMQMGANYNKKMAGIKEYQPILKMLEKYDFLDEDKLSYAIDIMSGDKAAIAKLLTDSEIDLYDIDQDSGESYAPSYKGVSEKEIELADTIDGLKDSPVYEETLKIATEVWDNASQQFIINNPTVLNVLEQHISSGIFETVWNEVERLQLLGKLEGLNSLEAYKVVGDHLNEQGVLGGSGPKKAAKSSKEQRQEATRRKKQATQRPKGSSRRRASKDVINPLSLSDEEFEKLGAEHLM